MDDAEATSFTLDELSDESGIDTRVIRSFIEQGLLRGPGKLGRYARYSRQHLDKLLAIKVLKEQQGLKLSEVRQQLLSMSEAQIEMLANSGSVRRPKQSALDYILSQTNQPGVSPNAVVPAANVTNGQVVEDDFDDEDYDDEDFEPRPKSKAPPVVQSSAQILEGWGPGPEYYQRITKERLSTPIGKLLVGLEEITGDKTIRRQAKKETWHRIQVTPDIELSVRGINDDSQLARLERVADYLREILSGEA